MIEGKYRRIGENAADESFHRVSEGDRARLTIGRRLGGDGILFDLAASLDPAWRVATLELKKLAGSAETRARYRWDGDDWVGELLDRGERREIGVPLAGGLEVIIPLPSFDGAFLRRIGLAPLTQRRVETLEIRLDDFETIQSHCIIERLADGARERSGAEIPASCYRWTDATGRQEFVWLDQDHVCLARSETLEAPPSYWLE